MAVRVEPLGGGPELDAFTLTSERRDSSLCASRRYMALLIDGAQTHGLPAEYVDWLRARPSVEETAEATAMRAALDRALGALKKKEPR